MTSGYVLAVQVPAGSSQTECTRRCTAMDSCQGPVWGRKTSCCKRLRQGRSSALGAELSAPPPAAEMIPQALARPSRNPLCRMALQCAAVPANPLREVGHLAGHSGPQRSPTAKKGNVCSLYYY